jgi:hypothetical protein
VNVLRIAATATATGMRIAGSVPKTKRRITMAPRPPITASSKDVSAPEPCVLRLLERVVAGDVDLDPGREAPSARRRGCPSAPLVVEKVARPAGRSPRTSCAGPSRRT